MPVSGMVFRPRIFFHRENGNNLQAMQTYCLRIFAIALVTLMFSRTVPAFPFPRQTIDSGKTAGFEPLDHWKTAVLSGDRAGLKTFYISSTQSYAVTPGGKTSDLANEESEFWSQLSGNGLTAVNAKILQETEPQPNVVVLVLRIELTFHSKNETHNSLVSGAQVWVNQGDAWNILIAQRSDLAPAPEMRLPEPATPNTHLYSEPEDATKELNEAMASAKADHKRVLVVFGANWCYDCHVLDEALHSDKIAPLVLSNYHVVHINIGEGKSNSDLANRFGVPLDKGVPSLAVLDSDGQVITSQKQGEFESAAKIGASDVIQFLDRWKLPAKK